MNNDQYKRLGDFLKGYKFQNHPTPAVLWAAQAAARKRVHEPQEGEEGYGESAYDEREAMIKADREMFRNDGRWDGRLS